MQNEHTSDIEIPDFDDDALDVWDEYDEFDADDDSLSAPQKSAHDFSDDIKKKSSGGSFIVKAILVFAIAGGAYYGYTLYVNKPSPNLNELPVVTIGTSKEAGLENNQALDDEGSNHELAVTKNVVDELDVASSKSPALTSVDDDNANVLTPFPNFAGNSDADLPPLEVGEQYDASSGTSLAGGFIDSTAEVIEGQDVTTEDVVTLENYSEDDFLTKTDSGYKENSIKSSEGRDVIVSQSSASLAGDEEVVLALPSDVAVEEGVKFDVGENVVDVQEEASVNSAPTAVPSVKPAKRPVQPVEKKAFISKKVDESKKNSESKKPVSWLIKGAKTGRAVIFDRNSGETKAVEVGDTVRGLGRIKYIGKRDGRWSVVGSRKTLSQ